MTKRLPLEFVTIIHVRYTAAVGIGHCTIALHNRVSSREGSQILKRKQNSSYFGHLSYGLL